MECGDVLDEEGEDRQMKSKTYAMSCAKAANIGAVVMKEVVIEFVKDRYSFL